MQLLSKLRRHHNERSQALIALTSASILWGITTPVLKWSLGESSPVFLFAFYRFLFAGVIFFILARPSVRIQKQHIPILVASLFVGTSIHIILAFYGIRLSTAMNASFIATASPFLTLLAGFFILREKLKSNLIIGGILGFLGMLFLIFGPMSSGDLSNTQVLGNALLILSILCWIGYEVVGKKYLFPYYSVRTITFYAFLIGCLSTLPFALKDIPTSYIYFSNPQFLIGVVFTAIFSSVLAFSMWQWGVSKIEVSRVGFFIYLDPITSSILAIFLLGESFTPSIIIGTIFVLFGLYVAEQKAHLLHIHLFHHYRGRKLRT